MVRSTFVTGITCAGTCGGGISWDPIVAIRDIELIKAIQLSEGVEDELTFMYR